MSVETARLSAQASAMRMLEGLYVGDPAEILERRFAETNHCWMFFNNRSIIIPPERALSAFAYVIAKRGGGRLVPDYWDDEVRMQEYLETISEYLATHDAETGQQHV